MKLTIRLFMAVVLFGTVAVSCKDKDSEKRIADLESKLAAMASASPSSAPAAATPTAPATKPDGPLPAFEWTATEHDFGTINEGEKVTHVYKFKNTGEVPLILENVKPSCGCTAPSWTKAPIPVGGEGEVEVMFDSNNKQNAQNKTVTVTANTWPKSTTLRFKTFVTPKAGGTTAGAPVKQ